MFFQSIDVISKEQKEVQILPRVLKIYDENMNLTNGKGIVEIQSKGKCENGFYNLTEKANIKFSLDTFLTSGDIPWGPQSEDGTYANIVAPYNLLRMIAGAIDKAYRGEYAVINSDDE